MILDLLDELLTRCGVASVERCASVEFGPTIGKRYAVQLAGLTDAQLIAGPSPRELAAMSDEEVAAMYQSLPRPQVADVALVLHLHTTTGQPLLR